MIDTADLINPDTDIKLFIDEHQTNSSIFSIRKFKQYDNKRSPNQRITFNAVQQKIDPASPINKQLNTLDMSTLFSLILNSETENLNDDTIVYFYDSMTKPE